MTTPSKVRRTTTNALVDLMLFLGFLSATAPRFTGLAIHEWLSLGLAGGIIIHLLLHWNWLVNVTRRMFGHIGWKARANYLLNSLLFIAFTTITFTGIMVSEIAMPLFGLQFSADGPWMGLHRLASDGMVILMGLHIALHWDWIVNVIKRRFIRQGRAQSQPVTLPIHSSGVQR